MTMAENMVKHMAHISSDAIRGMVRETSEYATAEASGDGWTCILGDCVEALAAMPDDSIGYSVFSPPFASLYTYSNSDRDMGNSADDAEFAEHFGFMVRELFRCMMPGRNVSFHCMNLPTSKCRHGYIGLRDFRGEMIRIFEDAGFIFHSEVCIWKDPVTAMQRTKALGLLHKQMTKDSAMSRQGIPDYVVTMRKPGDNPQPVSGELGKWVGDDSFVPQKRLSIDLWQRYASPVWMDIRPTRTLQYRHARDGKDERHICPLQLDVVERCVLLWSNPDDLVFSPFGGIGTEGYVAVKLGRRARIVELKESYWRVACDNMRQAEIDARGDALPLFASTEKTEGVA